MTDGLRYHVGDFVWVQPPYEEAPGWLGRVVKDGPVMRHHVYRRNPSPMVRVANLRGDIVERWLEAHVVHGPIDDACCTTQS